MDGDMVLAVLAIILAIPFVGYLWILSRRVSELETIVANLTGLPQEQLNTLFEAIEANKRKLKASLPQERP